VFGKMDYPLMDLSMSMPIEVECIQYDDFDMSAIFSKTQHTYEKFSPSLIKKTMTSRQSTIFQQQLYEEVMDDGIKHNYSLEQPNIIYEQIPALSITSETDHVENDCYLTLHSSLQPESPVFSTNEDVDYETLRFISDPLPELSTTSTDSRVDDPKLAAAASDILDSIPSTLLLPQVSAVKSSSSIQSNLSELSYTSSNPEENIAYLKAYTLADMLQLLDNMNLREHKKSFGENQIDGEMFVYLDKSNLEDLGVIKSIHQKRLIKLIDGTVSAKKYEGSAYEALKMMQTLA